MRGRPYSIHQQVWPTWDESLLVEEELTLAVQVNGRLRDQLTLPADQARDEAYVREQVLGLPKLQSYLANGTVQRVIVVPGKLVNVVVR